MADIKKALRPLLILFALILSLGVFIYFYILNKVETKGYLETTGVVEAVEVDISPKAAGRIAWLCCREGETVKAGAIAVRLDSKELDARVEEARAAGGAATEAVEEARASIENSRAQRESAASEVEAASAEIKRAEALTQESAENLERAKGLFKGGFIAKKELDAAKASFDANSAMLSSAVARKTGAVSALRSSAAGIRAAEARLSAAEAKSRQVSAELKASQARLEDTVMASPIDGVVAYMAFEPGEYVSPGASIYTVYGTVSLWARVDIEETRVRDIRLGGRAEVTPSGGGQAFSGKVTEIGEVGGFATQRDVTRGRSDIKTFRVKAAIERADGVLKPGMTVSVRLYYDGAR